MQKDQNQGRMAAETEQRLRINLLFDVYGELLTARQQEILAYYYQDDLSLSEIQELLSISRAAVSDALHKGIRAMEAYEKKLRLLKIRTGLQQMAEAHPEIAAELAEILDE